MTACRYPGCTGSYGPEGYCDECGRKAPADVAAAQTAAPGESAAGWARTAAGDGSAPATAGRTAVGDGSVPPSAGTAGRTALGGGTGGITSARGSRRRGTSASRRGATRGGLGAGLMDMPRIPLRDPASAVMADPVVSENRRYCVQCDNPVGRSRDGQPGLTEGFCPHCGTPFSFLPRLAAGDLVVSRYEILGCLAYGGLGWIYLARDRNVSDTVSDRWVVLKGLINTGDPDATAAAVTERRFLVSIDHPNIVKIHDFVQHPDPRTGALIGYIVMEYVGGRSLRDVLIDHRRQYGAGSALQLPQVLAYGVEILPALGYLHERELLFCDFKPDNVIHAEEQLKLIDLGAVRHMDDEVSAVYGTPGYQAPEVATAGPSVASDIYTVGRTLAVLSFNFTGFASTYADRLPDRTSVPLLAQEESYHRLLHRATHPDPDRRFGSAAEMREQLLGVLREVLSAADGVPRPALSARFTPERRAFGTRAGTLDDEAVAFDGPSLVAALPMPLVDRADPGAGFLASLAAVDAAEQVRTLQAAPVRSPEVAFRLVLARIDAGDVAGASADLDAAAAADPTDWRLDWYRGLVALTAGQPGPARDAFSAAYDALPGDPAPKLALAATLEWLRQPESAAALYERVWRTDHGYVSAAFGLARLRLAAGDRAAAVAVLDEVPDSSSHFIAAQVASVRARLTAGAATLSEPDLVDASTRLQRLALDAARRARLTVETLETALHWVRAHAGATASTPGRAVPPATRTPATRVLGHPLTERDLRFGLERSYRTLAKLAPDAAARIDLVDKANAVRPRTMV